jgi:hypothetical protein
MGFVRKIFELGFLVIGKTWVVIGGMGLETAQDQFHDMDQRAAGHTPWRVR